MLQKTYIANGQTVTLTADPTHVAVRFREPAPHSMRAEVSEALELGPFPRRTEIPGEMYTLLPVAGEGARGVARLSSLIDRAEGKREVARLAPVFRVGPNRVVATDRVIVAFGEGADDPRARLAAKGLEVVEERAGRFVVRLGEYEDPFQVSDELRKEPGVRYAEPDLVILGRHRARSLDPATAAPACPVPEAQYALRTTRAREAQQVQPGRRDVRVAVLDEGVDTLHPDLRGAVLAGFDATDGDGYQEPLATDSHGTACAGLAVGAASGPAGVRGVAAGCGLLPVRIARSDGLSGEWVTSASIIARGLDWSTDNGADVLSNSWGGGPPSTAVTEAIGRARTAGRGGRGCVVVFSAGNEDDDVIFPANQEGVLAVAACNWCDEPKKRDSSDGEHWWGSSFGPEVQIAAPGVRNYTTDNLGTSGRNASPSPAGDYDPLFNGTSSAAPIVAGAAALVLCANPALRESEVRELLCSTADKVGPVAYPNGRNHRMGHGRVNVLAAVRRALDLAQKEPGAATGPYAGSAPERGVERAAEAAEAGAAVDATDAALAATPLAGVDNYVVVGENGADPDHWRVLRQESDLGAILHYRAHDGRPWHAPRRAGAEFVQPITLRNLRTGTLDSGSIYRVKL